MSALPTGDELKTLPLRAVVAYAHRCAARAARRCLPDAGANGGMPSAFGCGEAVRRALRPAAKVAAGETVSSRELTAAEDVIVATVARLGRGDEDRDENGRQYADGTHLNPTGRGVAMTANSAYAALAAASAVADETAGSRSIRGHRAVLSALTAAEAAAGACPPIRIGIRRDFGLLSRLSLGSFPDLGRGVDVSDGGPLGCCGEDNRLAAVGAAYSLDDAPGAGWEEDAEDDETGRPEAERAAEADDGTADDGRDEPHAAPATSVALSGPGRSGSDRFDAGFDDPFDDALDDPFGDTLPAVMNDPFASPTALTRWSPSAPEPGDSHAAADAGAARSSAALARREAGLAARDAALSAREASLAERIADLAEREADLADREAELADREAELADRETELDDRDAALEERAVALDAATRAVAERTRTAVGELTAVRAERQELADAAAALQGVLDRHPLLRGTSGPGPFGSGPFGSGTSAGRSDRFPSPRTTPEAAYAAD